MTQRTINVYSNGDYTITGNTGVLTGNLIVDLLATNPHIRSDDRLIVDGRAMGRVVSCIDYTASVRDFQSHGAVALTQTTNL